MPVGHFKSKGNEISGFEGSHKVESLQPIGSRDAEEFTGPVRRRILIEEGEQNRGVGRRDD
jgi:hypothetical protein